MNGLLVASKPASGVLQQNSDPLYLGGDYDNTGTYFQGAMDDVNEILVGAKKTFPISIFAAKGRAARVEDNAAGAASGLRSLRADEPTKE